MRILVVTQNYYPDNFLINDICPRLVKDGHDVTVLTGLPDYSSGEIPEEYKNGKKREEYYSGVKIIRVEIRPRKTGVINRLLNYISFVKSSLKKIKHLEPNYDLIFAYQTSPVSMAHAAVWAGKNWNVPVLLYCLDLWPESVKVWNLNENNLLFPLIRRYSKWIYSNVDHIAVSSKPFTKYLNDVHKIPMSEMSYLPQHSNRLDVSTMNTNSKQLFNDGKVHFVYAGNLGAAQKVEWVIESANQLFKQGKISDEYSNHNWQIDIFGNGSEYDNLITIRNDYNLNENVVFHGRIDRAELNQYYQEADVFLLTLQQDNAVGSTLPAKLQGYMSAGKPIVAMASGAVTEVLNDSGAGICVSGINYEKFADAMKIYLLDPIKRKKDGVNTVKYFNDNFTIDAYMDNFYNIIDGNGLKAY